MELPGFSQLARVHEGGQAVVYRARRSDDDRPFVLKVLKGPYPTPAQQAAFREELRLTRHVAGPGVAHVEGAFDVGDLSVLVLRDDGCESLERLFAAPPPLEVALGIARDLIDALDHVHRAGVLHLDVNPSNVVCRPDGTGLQLIDFGVSVERVRMNPELAAARPVRGTLAFAAPEQSGPMNRSVDARADTYALGATLYWLLTGRPPFEASDPLELVHAHVAQRPRPVHELAPVPPTLSAVVARLLEKNPEDRYQSAAGLQADLDRVARREAFTPGADDRPARFAIPERLYGRGAALEALAGAFARVAAGGREVVFVEGTSGMGKSSLVHEACRAMPRAAVATGKFDRFEQDRPYASLSRALGPFLRRLLGESPAEVEAWRVRLGEALGPNGGLMTALLPELERVVGAQAPVADLPALEAEARLHRTARRFVRALGRPDRPLVLFLDDLQWADAATLALLRVLTTDVGGHVLWIGAYRSDAIGPRLRGLVRDLIDARVERTTVEVGPLAVDDVERLLEDTLGRDDVGALARLCVDKTAGNPFFLHRFLTTAAEQGHVRRVGSHWDWDSEALAGLAATDNVVGFLTARVAELPPTARASLQAASVLGDRFGEAAVAALVDAVELDTACARGFIEETPADGGGRRFRFAHDRVREALYDGIEPGRRHRWHRAVGQRLLTSGQGRIYEVVQHLNAGGPPDDPLALATLNLEAGRRALAASAHGPARTWLGVARAHLAWSDAPDAMRQATEGAARAAYLTGDHDGMDALVDEALAHADDPVDAVRALRVRIDSLITRNRHARALEVGFDALGRLGVTLSPTPTEADIGAALASLGPAMEGVDLASLPQRAPPEAPTVRAAMELTCALAPPAYFVNQALLPLLGVELVRSTLEHGPTAQSSYGFALLGLVLCSVGEIDQGHAMGQLAMGLAGAFDDPRARVRAGHVAHGFVRHWKESPARFLPDYRDLLETAVDLGEFEYAGYSAMMLTIFGFYLGSDLDEVAAAAAHHTAVMKEIRQEASLVVHTILHQAVLNLRGEADDPTELTGAVFDEPSMRALFEELQDPTSLFVLHCVKGVLAGLYDDWDLAGRMLDTASTYLHGAAATVHLVALDQWRALVALRRAEAGDAPSLEVFRHHQERLEAWARHNPATHGHRPLLMAAAQARGEGRHHEALQGFERAAAAAAERGLPMDEAVALRFAGEVCLAQGLETAAGAYLLQARYAFGRWGALGVARAMEVRYPTRLGHLSRGGEGAGSRTLRTASTGGTDLDVAAVVRVSQAIAAEKSLGRLIETIIRVSMASSGAQRCVVAGPHDDGLQVVAVGRADPEVEVVHRTEALDDTSSAASILRYVARAREAVVLEDARRSPQFAESPYVQARQPQSVLCVPIEQQGRLLAVLYLEHRDVPGLFDDARLAFLRVIFGQAAIAVDNARLIDTLEEKVRHRTRELAAATDQALSANQAKTTFLRSMSHELRTPLNAILGFAQLLERRRGDPEAHREAVATIEASGRHLLALLNDLLDLGRIEAGRLELDLEPVRLQGFTESVTGLFAPAVRDKHLAFHVVCEGLPDSLETDPRRVRQILINLVGNAVKFTARGEVRVHVRPEGGWLRFDVSDTGPGIPPDELERIFDPFEQAGAASERAMGTGLGLAIARQIARQLGGDLSVVSAVGQGSTFTLELPLRDAGPATLPDVASVAVAPVDLADLARPDAAVLERLRRLAVEGALAELEAEAEALGADPALRAFAARLGHLARDFDDEGVQALLA